jgi:hypothetical protein
MDNHMSLPRSLLDAMAAHVADENAKADRARDASRTAAAAGDPEGSRALLADSHDHATRALVWHQAHGLAAPHANPHHLPTPRDTHIPDTTYIPGRVRLGHPGDHEPGEGDE